MVYLCKVRSIHIGKESSMSDTKNVAFRSAIGGYNREDVNRYILDINRALQEKSAQADEAESRAETLSAELDAITADKTALEGIRASLQEAIDQLKEENEALREKLAAAEAENARLAVSPEDGDKSQKYDRISAQIGDIMISANTSADAIVAAANDHAAKIITDTENEANDIRTRLSAAADDMLSEISGELRASTEGYLFELSNALCEMRDNTSAMVADFQKRSRELSMKVEYYQTTLSDTVNTALKQMDEKYGIRRPSAEKSGG